MRKFHILLIVFFFLFIDCRTTNTDVQKSADSQNYKSSAIEKYENNIDYIFNSSKTHVICLKSIKSTPQIPQNQISFFIYDLGDKEIIFEESSIDAEVEWINDYQVQVKITPGIISGDETPDDFIYFYNIKSRKKTN